MPTIADVAKRAGVSKMTVSRVINNSGYISQETRSSVQRAIEELGYIPNALARSLRHKQTSTIALVLTDIMNPFFTTIARGVEDAASEQGFTVMFCNTDESHDEEIEYLKVLIQKQVDGLLLVPAQSSRDSVDLLQSHALPFVLLDRRIPDAEVDTVRGDSEGGAYDLITHLVRQGHEHIAFLGGVEKATSVTDRLAGYRRALNEAGLAINPAHIFYDSFTYESGCAMAKQALEASPRPTALFGTNNLIAVGAFHALRALGLRVPEDISLVAFDDIPEFMVIDPFFTVVLQPAYEIGRQAALLLLERLAGEGARLPQEIILPTQLVIRRSSQPDIK